MPNPEQEPSVISRRIQPAAGVVALKGSGINRKVLVVHRPEYDDWTLPKGKPDGAELLPETAVREFTEETGYRLKTLGMPLGSIEYPMSGALKRVSYWRGFVAKDSQEAAHIDKNEVDRVEWWPLHVATRDLTYADELDVLHRAATVPPTLPLIVVRHAKALNRKEWLQDDALRPLSERGRLQAAQLRGLLGAFGVRQLASSSSERCLATIRPYSEQIGKKIESIPAFSEEAAHAHPEQVLISMDRIIHKMLDAGHATVVCGHRPVLPEMLARLGTEFSSMQTAEAWVAHVDAFGQTVTVEKYLPRPE